ncbi:MAG TPA: Obg family GTPase CgtA, partial [Solirubrobacteraceae bacterium]|nr:Obg family GTPase CgtA [Solirubrobacteraceae bacterium]
LAAHDERLARLPRVLALSKADLVPPQRVGEEVSRWSERLGADVPVIATSSATGAGLGELAVELLRLVPAIEQAGQGTGRGVGPGLAAGSGVEVGQSGNVLMSTQPGGGSEPELAEHMVFRPAASTGFAVERIGPGSFAVNGRGIERLVARYDVENEDAMAYLEGRLRKIGVLRALEAEGFQPGDDLEIAGVVFELDPDETA